MDSYLSLLQYIHSGVHRIGQNTHHLPFIVMIFLYYLLFYTVQEIRLCRAWTFGQRHVKLKTYINSVFRDVQNHKQISEVSQVWQWMVPHASTLFLFEKFSIKCKWTYRICVNFDVISSTITCILSYICFIIYRGNSSAHQIRSIVNWSR